MHISEITDSDSEPESPVLHQSCLLRSQAGSDNPRVTAEMDGLPIGLDNIPGSDDQEEAESQIVQVDTNGSQSISSDQIWSRKRNKFKRFLLHQLLDKIRVKLRKVKKGDGEKNNKPHRRHTLNITISFIAG